MSDIQQKLEALKIKIYTSRDKIESIIMSQPHIIGSNENTSADILDHTEDLSAAIHALETAALFLDSAIYKIEADKKNT